MHFLPLNSISCRGLVIAITFLAAAIIKPHSYSPRHERWLHAPILHQQIGAAEIEQSDPVDSCIYLLLVWKKSLEIVDVLFDWVKGLVKWPGHLCIHVMHINVHKCVLGLAVLQVPLKAWSDLACCVLVSATTSVLQTRKETAVSISMLVLTHLAPFIVDQGWLSGLGRFGTEMLFISVIWSPKQSLHLRNTWTAHSKEGFLLLQVPILKNLAVPPGSVHLNLLCLWHQLWGRFLPWLCHASMPPLGCLVRLLTISETAHLLHSLQCSCTWVFC